MRRYSVGGGRDALSCRVVGGGFEGFFPVMAATCVFGKPLADGLRKKGGGVVKAGACRGMDVVCVCVHAHTHTYYPLCCMCFDYEAILCDFMYPYNPYCFFRIFIVRSVVIKKGIRVSSVVM